MTTKIVPRATEEQAEALLTIMPVSLLAHHRKLAQAVEDGYWGSGELSINLQEEFYPEYSKAAIRKAVGNIYSISMNTVRDRERIFMSVDVALRNAVPFLKFSHWRNIVPAGQEEANNILWEAVTMFEAEGRGPSVDQILAWRNTEGMDATPPWIYRLQKGVEKFEMTRDDPRADPQIRMICEKAIIDIEERSAKLKLERFQLKDGTDEES